MSALLDQAPAALTQGQGSRLVATSLNKRYKKRTVVHDVSL